MAKRKRRPPAHLPLGAEESLVGGGGGGADLLVGGGPLDLRNETKLEKQANVIIVAKWGGGLVVSRSSTIDVAAAV